MQQGTVRILLGATAACAALFNLQSVLLPMQPNTALPPLGSLPWQKLDTASGSSDGPRLIGPSTRFLLPEFPGFTLQLTRIADRRVVDLEVASITRKDPQLQLVGRQLIQLPSKQPQNLEVAVGRVSQQPALQSCLLGNGAAVTKQNIRKLHESSPLTLTERWLQLLLGWRATDSSCLLVTIRGPKTAQSSDLLEIWDEVLPALRPLTALTQRS